MTQSTAFNHSWKYALYFSSLITSLCLLDTDNILNLALGYFGFSLASASCNTPTHPSLKCAYIPIVFPFKSPTRGRSPLGLTVSTTAQGLNTSYPISFLQLILLALKKFYTFKRRLRFPVALLAISAIGTPLMAAIFLQRVKHPPVAEILSLLGEVLRYLAGNWSGKFPPRNMLSVSVNNRFAGIAWTTSDAYGRGILDRSPDTE